MATVATNPKQPVAAPKVPIASAKVKVEKIATDAGGGMGDMSKPDSAMCATHGKMRSIECLQEDGNDYVCLPRKQCKAGGFSGFQTSAPIKGGKGKGKGGKGKGKGGKPAGASGDGTGFCAVHHKQRSINSLMDDGWGGLCCLDTQQCKVSQNAAVTAPFTTPNRAAPYKKMPPGYQATTGFCSLHGKARSWSVMEEDGYRGWKCIDGHECKIKEGETPYQPTTGICTMHDKLRSLSVLSDATGSLICVEGQECKISTRPENEYAKGEPEILDNGLTSQDTALCSTHQKRRSAGVMMTDGMGGYMCKPGEECKAGARDAGVEEGRPTSAICSAHGKKRSMMCLEEDGIGGYSCTANYLCK